MMPLEWGYADDVDFVNEDEDVLLQLLPICKEILKEWNLYVNESKTEFTKVYLAGKDDVDAKGEPLRHREEWRKSKSLVSKLCSKTDILHRCNLGNLAFQNYKKIWMQVSKGAVVININTLFRLIEILRSNYLQITDKGGEHEETKSWELLPHGKDWVYRETLTKKNSQYVDGSGRGHRSRDHAEPRPKRGHEKRQFHLNLSVVRISSFFYGPPASRCPMNISHVFSRYIYVGKCL